MALLASAAKHHTVYVFDQDDSLYDAFNIGWRGSSGSFIAFLNSDDWYEPEFLESALQWLQFTDADWVFGDVVIHRDPGDATFLPGSATYMRNPWTNFSKFHHTTVLARRAMFETLGGFPEEVVFRKGQRLRLKLCADYGWFLKAQREGFHGSHCDFILGHMEDGGVSQSNRQETYAEAVVCACAVFPERGRSSAVVWSLRLFIDDLPPSIRQRIPNFAWKAVKSIYATALSP